MLSKAKARARRDDNGHPMFSIGVLISVAIVAATIASLPSPHFVWKNVAVHTPPHATAAAAKELARH